MKRFLGWAVFLTVSTGYAWWVLRSLAIGFSPGASGAPALRETDYEAIFRSQPKPQLALEDLTTLTREPHVAGSPADRKTAEYVLNVFRRSGLEAEIVEYQVLLAIAKEVKVELVSPERRQAPTPEAGWNPESDELVPAFNAFSPSGEITAPVVYANYGLPEDYGRLRQLGIEVAGKVVIVRYGQCFRGVKVSVAEENRVGALLIYSDPGDDGYRRGKVYPLGPWRPATAVQRGSIRSLNGYPGDPLTPGVAATPGANRLNICDVPLPRVPTTPLSYRDAAPILKNLHGPRAPRAWQGGLPFTYHLGPGASRVHLKLDMAFQIRPIWDVVGKISGTVSPEEWVVAGNHRDAWAYGAADPASGTAALTAVARGLGQLLSQGWRPRRSIVLASWDAEEFGLMGSTEWAEEHAGELSRNGVAYINMDIGVSGSHFSAATIPSLKRLIYEATASVKDPRTGQSVFSVWKEENLAIQRQDESPPVVESLRASKVPEEEPQVRELGSGSDYTPFLQHLGVPSADISFVGPYGVYHSSFDNLDWMKKFGDPGFKYAVAAAQLYGTMVMRLADDQVLPFNHQDYGRAIESYLRDLAKEVERTDAGVELRLRSAQEAAAEFSHTAEKLEHRLNEINWSSAPGARTVLTVNQSLLEVERNFLLDKGLPGRPWFRHALYAPGVYTGYRATILPGVREALGRQDWAMAREQLFQVEMALRRSTGTLGQALEALDREGRAVIKERPGAQTGE